MLQKKHEKQQSLELVILEQMIPADHLLRRIGRSIDFSFIRRLCAPLYCENNGRPAIDPEVLFRMLFVGYLYGIRSERRLEEETLQYGLQVVLWLECDGEGAGRSHAEREPKAPVPRQPYSRANL